MDEDPADFPNERFSDDEEGGGEAQGRGLGDTEDSPDTAPPQRGFEKPKKRRGEAVINDDDDDEEEEEDDDDDDGIDLMKEGGSDDDSSEEDEDDPEEARLVAEGFIVDEADAEQSDDDAAERKRKKKRRLKKLRHKKKQQQQEEEEEGLDDDDLELLAENRGESGSSRRRRFRRGSATPEAESSSRNRDLARIFDDDEDEAPMAPRRLALDDEDEEDEDLPSVSNLLNANATRKTKQRLQPQAVAYPEDDMDDFIDDDDDSDEAAEMADMDEDEREERRREKRERKKADREARRANRGGFGGGIDPNKAGIDPDTWEEINEIFGDGSDYLWAFKKGDQSGDEAEEDVEMEDEEGLPIERKKKVEFKDIFEPGALKERMLTDADHRVKQINWPERFQLMLPGEEGLKLLEAPLESADLDRATLWSSTRISNRCNNDFNTPGGIFYNIRQQWLGAVRLFLEYIVIDRLEVPFLYGHRGDQLTHDAEYADPVTGRPRQISYLTRRELHILTALAFRWKTLHGRKASVKNSFDQMNLTAEGAPAQRQQFETMLDQVQSLEELSDLTEWLTMQYGPRMRDAQARLAAEEETTGGLNGIAGASTFKRPSVVGRYEQIKGTVVSELAKRFGISSTEVSDNFIAGPSARRYFPDDESTLPEVLAEQFVDVQAGARSADAALTLAKMIMSHEISKEPMLRRAARTSFKDLATITIRPTEKGSAKIDEEHPFWNFKYLEAKPVKEFLAHDVAPQFQPATYGGRQPAQPLPSQVQFLMILEAEAQDLVTVEIALPDQVQRDFEEQLYQAFASEGVSAVSQKWNTLRKDVVKAAVEESLIPTGRLWTREWLKEECSEWLCKTCEAILEKRLDARPYESRSMVARRRFPNDDESDDGRGDDSAGNGSKSIRVPSVLAVSHGQGDPRRDAIAAVFIDAAGRFRMHTTFDNITALTPEQQEAVEAEHAAEAARAARRGEVAAQSPGSERARFLEMLVRLQPDVIVVNGFSPRTVAFRKQLEELAEEARTSTISEKRIPDEQADKASIDVIYSHDDTARLFQHSQRAADEFPGLKTLHRYCVGLARYVQSPVLEFASLGDDLMVIKFHPHQRIVPQERLRMYVERSIVSSVNDVGVDLNKAVGDVYYRNLLPFVCGLGPRKARSLVDAIVKKLEGTVVNRRALLDHNILSWHIFANAAATLKVSASAGDFGIRADRVDPSEKEKLLPDVLDATRIHPEDYRYARKMASDALNLDEEDLEGEHASHPCALLLQDPEAPRKLRELDILSYAQVLFQQQGERKKLTLESCVDELLRPYGEIREPFKLPTPDEMLVCLTGETTRTLDRESIVNVTVSGVFPSHITVRLDCGIEGTINEQYVLPLELEDYEARGEKPPRLKSLVRRDQTLKAQIIDIDKDKMQLELTAKPAHLVAAENMRLANVSVAIDPRYWNAERAEKDKRQAEFKKQAAKNRSSTARFIRHPNFRNFKAGQAEEYLANQPRGAVIVRPSSKGNDHLAITWKVDDNVFQHLDVLELEKENEYSLGQILRVMNVTYNDLDELIVNHINPMARMVESMINHEKYKGSERELEQFLTSWCLANPSRSTYAFGIDPKHPGYFKLGFKANRDAQIEYWPVKVLPGRYKLNQADTLPDVASLANAFKVQYTAKLGQAQGQGRATPYGGAAITPFPGQRTPGRALGGQTPGRVIAGGQTPGYHGGRTPGAPQPPGPPPGAPPGPPPSFTAYYSR